MLEMTPEEIKELRERLGLSQRGAAKLIPVEGHTWMRWEKGYRRPHSVCLEKLHQLRDSLEEPPMAAFELVYRKVT